MPLSFCAYGQEVLLRVFRWFFFSLSLLPEAESECRVCPPAPWMKQVATHSGQSGEEWLLSPGWTSPVGSENNHTSFVVVCPFHASGDVFFLLVIPFLRIFPWSFFLPNQPLFSFTSIFAPFSEPHQAVISVLGAKVIPGLDGKARSSLLFSVKISSCG